MSVFSSQQERRLWAWTLAVVLAIYSTLGLARTLAGALRDRGMIDGFFVAGMVLVAATLVALGLRRRPRRAEVGIALGVAAVYFLVLVRMASAEERTHLIEYGVVAGFIHEALKERARQGRRVPAPAVWAVVATALVGTLDECIQALLPSRVFDLRDILFNALAALMAVGASAGLSWARSRR